MSAIFAVLDRSGSSVHEDDLAPLSGVLGADGPDGGGQTVRGPAALGQRLMSFLPEDVHDRQPLFCPAAGLSLVADGRIDNRQELARELGLSTVEAQEMADSEFILRACQRWSERCLPHLVGDFAFICWNGRENMLLAATSAPTSRPLFYHLTSRRLALATRLEALLALPEVERRVDLEWVAGFLCDFDLGFERTAFSGVRRLHAGQLLMCGGERFTVTNWWTPDLRATLELGSDQDYVEAVNEVLNRATAEQLRSAGRVGIAVSGGLDSSSVAAVAAQVLAPTGGRLAAFTEVPAGPSSVPLPEGRYADEGPLVQALAAAYPNLDLELVPSRWRDEGQGLEAFFAAAGMPYPGAANRHWIEEIVSRARAAGVTTMMGGDYGNLTVSWAGTGSLAELVRRGQILSAGRQARALAQSGAARSTASAFLRSGLEPLLPDRLVRFVPGARMSAGGSVLPLINPAFAAEHAIAERRVVRRLRVWGVQSRKLRLDSIRWMAVRAGQTANAYRLLHGLDARSPLGDRRLVEFCLALPEAQYERDGQRRRLIRRAMAGRLPQELLRQRGRGLQSADWFERADRQLARRRREVERFEKDPLVSSVIDVSQLKRVLDDWPAQGPVDQAGFGLLRNGLEQILMTGRFLLWVQSTSSAVPLASVFVRQS